LRKEVIEACDKVGMFLEELLDLPNYACCVNAVIGFTIVVS
jgi:hypothetical protein